jgi:MFS superfamily sulfate permease-like transporter
MALDEVDPCMNIPPTALLCLMIGMFTFLLGFFRLGFLDSVFSRALLRGFILAVAAIIMIDMSDALLGLTPAVGQCGQVTSFEDPPAKVTPISKKVVEQSPFLQFIQLLNNLYRSHLLTTCLSVFSIAFLFGMKAIKKLYPTKKWLQLMPEILIIVVLTTLCTWLFRWDCHGVAILGKVKTGTSGHSVFPSPTIPKIKHLMLSSALISMIGFVESIAVAKTYASKHDYVVSPNREVI